jgi:hypothetical protein
MPAEATVDLVANIAKLEGPVKKADAVMDKSIEEMKKLEAQASHVFESTRTPVERMQKEVAELNALFKKGLIDVETYNRAVSRAKVPDNRGFFQQLKGMTGGESSLGMLGQLAMGGGAIAGLTMTAKALEQMAQGADKFAQAMRSGAMNSADVRNEITQSIPLVREFYNIRAAITNLIWPVPPDVSKEVEAQRDLFQSLKQQKEELQAASDLDRQRLKIQHEYEQSLSKISAQAKELKSKGGDAKQADATAEAQRKLAEQIRAEQLRGMDKAAAAPSEAILKGLAQQELALKRTKAQLLENALTDAGATEAQVKLAMAYQTSIEALEKKKKAADEAKATEEANKKAVEQTIENLQAQADTMGMDKASILAHELALKGATQAQIDQAEALRKTVEAQDEFDKTQDKIKATIEANKTPLEKYKDTMKALAEQLAAGLPQETYDRAAAAAREAMDKAGAGGGNAFEEFTSAFSRIANAAAGRKSPVDLAAQQVEATQTVAKGVGEVGGKIDGMTSEIRGLRDDLKTAGPARFGK